MGCVFSNAGDNDPRIFAVTNVDDRGLTRNPGKIEVTDTELILHRPGDEPIRWPLRCLRRYGCDLELFSFESGRRCPTGQGIYAFKCIRAEALFNLLQECVARAGQDDQQLAVSDRATPTPAVETQLNGNVLSATVPPYSPQSARGEQVHYVNGDVVPENTPDSNAPQVATRGSQLSDIVPNSDVHEYINTHVFPGSSHTTGTDSSGVQVAIGNRPHGQENGKVIKYAVLNLPPLHGKGITRGRLPSVQSEGNETAALLLDPSSSQAMYVNVGAESVSDSVPRLPNSDVFLNSQAAALNKPVAVPTVDLTPTADEPPTYLNVKLNPATNHTKQGYREKFRAGAVTYIQLDLKSDDKANGNNVPASPISLASSANLDSPSRRTESYAKIDFDKTRALQNSTTQAHDEEGSRKTRHNSNIDDLT